MVKIAICFLSKTQRALKGLAGVLNNSVEYDFTQFYLKIIFTVD